MKFEPGFLLENAAWPAFVVEPGGTIRVANHAALAFFGPALEGEGTTLAAIWAQEGESADQFLARVDRSAVAHLPLKFRGKGAAIITFNAQLSASRDVQRRVLFQLFREAPAAPVAPAAGVPLKAASAESPTAIKQKLDCALQLTRTVALDFNNALTSILGHTSLVLSRIEQDNPWRASLLEVEKAAEKAAEIAHQLAGFSRQEKESQEMAAGNLNLILRRVLDSFQQTPRENVRWSVQFENDLYSVRFDEAKMQQAFVKIVENAVEALSSNSGHITISSRNLDLTVPTQDRTTQLQPGAYACIEVCDDGCGMEEEVLPRIFEPFFTTKQNHRGLGLAWVYGIATNHGGGVAVSSQVRQGTSVRLYLPASGRAHREAERPDTELRGQQTVLMVDDENLLLTMGQVILSAFGYRVLTANNGLRALELLNQSGSDVGLVIVDLVMPQMSGRELIDQVRGRHPGLPILCTSGYVLAGGQGEQSGFLQKPFTSQELLRRVRHLLDAA